MTYRITFTDCATMTIYHCHSRLNAIDKAILQKNCPAYQSRTNRRKAIISAKSI
jgi:hypothetical protein